MDIERKVCETIEKYGLLSKEDKVVVALSGGKDSTSVLWILKKLGYDVSGLMIDLRLGDWSEKNKENMVGFCKELGVKLHVIDLRRELGGGICFIKDVVKRKKGLTGCSVCGVIKKWLLNRWAKKLGADKIVTGHNLDDEAQTVLMNFLKGNVLLGAGFGPFTGLESSCKGFVQRVKPLFFIPENEIRKFSKKMKFPVLYERCPCAFGTYRVETRAWVDNFSDAEKLKIVNGWLKVVPGLRGGFSGEVGVCGICGEPARGEICNACKIFECLRE